MGSIDFLNVNVSIPSNEFGFIILISSLFASALLAQSQDPRFNSLDWSSRIDASAANCKYALNEFHCSEIGGQDARS